MIEIIIPAHNCSKTLSRTLASLASQTDSNFVVHIIDDCSTENLMPIISRYNWLNIRVTRNKTNLGCGMSRQVGINMTDADYVAFLDSDDVLLPYTVETWRSMAESTPDIDIFHSYFYEQTRSSIDEAPLIVTIKNGFTWCHGKLYRTDFLREYNIQESPEVRWADDSYFNAQCTELGEMAIIPFPMYMWLNNNESITRNPNGEFQNTSDRMDDFVHAMKLSAEKVLQYKDTINWLPETMQKIESNKNLINNSLKDYEYLKEVIECH